MTGIPWRLIGIVAAAALLAWAGIWVTGRIRVSYQAELERDTAIATHADYKAKAEKAAAEASALAERDALFDANTAARIEALEGQRDRLARMLARINPVAETHDANGNPTVAINPDWWLCLSTHVTRDPADAVACEARAGAAGVPDPVSR